MATSFRTPDTLLEQGDIDPGTFAAGDAPIYNGSEFEGNPVQVPVRHLGNANVARPDVGDAVVVWTGWVEPLNAAEWDAYKKIPVIP